MHTPTLSNVTILIVEDNADIRTSLARFLQRQGAVVLTTADAFEGLKVVRKQRPHLVLSDISLPVRSGFRLLEEIRVLEIETETRVPVIAMTAFFCPSRPAREPLPQAFRRTLKNLSPRKNCWT